MSATSRVFVYGTLMRGEHHHDTLSAAQFVAAASTAPSYTLWLVDYYPALVHGGVSAVRGEVYAVDDAVLAMLDVLEDVPALYLREAVTLADGSYAEAYVLPAARVPPSATAIASGDFAASRARDGARKD